MVVGIVHVSDRRLLRYLFPEDFSLLISRLTLLTTLWINLSLVPDHSILLGESTAETVLIHRLTLRSGIPQFQMKSVDGH